MICTIENIHVELTNACYARCVFCSRQRLEYPIAKRSISLDFFKNIVPFKQLNGTIVFCGSIGEPICYDELLNLLLYIRTQNSRLSIQVHTNASSRDEEWWTTLASRLKYNPKNQVTFAIDGIGKTQEIYRIGTSFTKIYNNLKAFTRAGGNAYIKFLIFDYNKHHLKEMKQIATDLKCELGVYSSYFYDDVYKKPSEMVLTKQEKAIKNPKIPTCDLLDYHMAFLGSDQKFYPCCYIYNRSMKVKTTTPFLFQGQLGFDTIADLMNSELVSYIKENKNSLDMCKSLCAYKYKDGVLKLT